MMNQAARIQKQDFQETALNPEIVADIFKMPNLTLVSTSPSAAIPSQPRREPSNFAQSWFAALVFMVGIGSLSLQHQKQKAAIAPISIHQEAPLLLPVPKAPSLPSVKAEVNQKRALKKEANFADVRAKLERIAKRADVINVQARSI